MGNTPDAACNDPNGPEPAPAATGACFSLNIAETLLQKNAWIWNAVVEAPFPMSIHADDGEVLLYNRSWMELSGYAYSDIPTVEDWTEKAFGANRCQKARNAISKLYGSGGRVDEGISAIRAKEGGRRIWDFSSSPIGKLPDGRRLVVSMARDITEQRAAEEELRKEKAGLEAARTELLQEHEKLQSLLHVVAEGKRQWERSMDCISDLVVLMAPDGKIRRCNRPFQQFVGLEFQEILNSSCAELFRNSGIPLDPLVTEDTEFLHEPTGRCFYLRRYAFAESPPGSCSPVEIVRNGFVITLQDVTERRRILDEIADRNDRLNEANRQLKNSQAQILQQEKMASIGQLAAGVAHEINNPIGFISSNLGTLRKYADRLAKFISVQEEALARGGNPAEDVRAARAKLRIDRICEDVLPTIDESLEGAERVRRIVQDLKSFSRVDQAEVKETDLNESISSTINIAWNEIKYKATLRKDFGELPPVSCNPQQLNQVFMNLLVNAAQAIDTQGEIVVRTRAENGFILVSVKDTGCGIPAANVDRMFEPFFTTKEVGKGTGLGLSIAYDIVKKHRGHITVESEVGKGSTFTVHIPIGEAK